MFVDLIDPRDGVHVQRDSFMWLGSMCVRRKYTLNENVIGGGCKGAQEPRLQGKKKLHDNDATAMPPNAMPQIDRMRLPP